MIKVPTGALFAAALIVVATPAAGQTGTDPAPTRTVFFSDLDLATQAGQVTLKRRVAAAIERVCGSYAGANQDQVGAIKRCRVEAALKIQPQLKVLQHRGGQIALAD